MTQTSRRPATFRNLGDGDVGLWVAFEDKDQAKAMPAARWDPGLKCWRVPFRFAEDVQHLVDRLNGVIDGPLEDALETMFSRIPVELRAATWKSILKVWHPDAGGNTRIAQALGQVWERIK